MYKAGTPQDKLRMFIIYYLCNANVSPGELDQYLIQLKDANCDIETIKYIKRYKAISKMNFSAASNQASSGASSAAIDFTAASAKLIRIRIFYIAILHTDNPYFIRRFSNLLSKSSKFLEGIKIFNVKQNVTIYKFTLLELLVDLNYV